MGGVDVTSDLGSALAAASRAFAVPIAKSYASGNRNFTVRLERPGAPATYDRDTGQWTDREMVLIYTGPARIFPSNEEMENVGDEERVPFNAVTATLDYFTDANAPDPTLRPEADDLLTVVDDAVSQDAHLPNRAFEVTGVALGGYLSTGWTLSAVGAAPSGHGQ